MKTNEILENIKARRSVRAYTGQQVSEEDCRLFWRLLLMRRAGCIWRHGISLPFRMPIN